jgi:hypothetical protein
MDVGFLLPYLLLVLTVLEEHYAVWIMFFFIIPLLDVMFYVEAPNKKTQENYWCGMCMCMWFPLVSYTSCYLECSYRSMISMGLLYNSSMCLADEFQRSGLWAYNAMGDLINDHLGFVNPGHMLSVVRSGVILYLIFIHDRLLWHLGAVFIASFLHEYICWAENTFYPLIDVSHYGLANYSMFRFQHSKSQLLPTSHMWVGFHVLLQKFVSFVDLD